MSELCREGSADIMDCSAALCSTVDTICTAEMHAALDLHHAGHYCTAGNISYNVYFNASMEFGEKTFAQLAVLFRCESISINGHVVIVVSH